MECRYNGEKGYSATLNAYDAGNTVYDKNGKIIANISYACGKSYFPSEQLMGRACRKQIRTWQIRYSIINNNYLYK